jgi:multidrug efflux pump subunit AcrA (membrane-fusion protein)
MKLFSRSFLGLLALWPLLAPAKNASNTIILGEAGVKNLRIETVMAEESVFEETIFALGRIEIYPGRKAVLSSRIPGRALEVPITLDHPIKAGDTALVVESRQPGNPPPQVRLPAPITGLVSAVNVAPGQPLEPTDVLAEILDLTDVYAIARVPEYLAGRLKVKQMARITAPAVPDRVFEADLEHIGASADPESGTVEAAFHVQNPDLALRPGMRAEFSIIVDRKENVFTVPRAAVQGDPSNRFVFVKDFELPNAFIKTPVVTGRMNDQSVEILSGLFPADEVVTRGAYSLSFVGGGTISLKEALDAAHGHEHAEDGSELTEANKPKPQTSAGEGTRQSPFWMIVSGCLFVALIFVSFRKSHA